jgi:hypothetical protein
MCESLLSTTPEGGLEPGLATDISYTDATTLVVKLREGVTFWDGSALTADDVVYSVEKARTNEVSQFGGDLASVASVEATDASTVTIKLSEPNSLSRGGLSTGAPKGNKNATTHGRFEQIMFSSFTDEENEMIEHTSLDPMKQIDDELKIIIVREKRMLDRYKKAQQDDYTITQIEEIERQSGNRLSTETKTIKENNDIFLHKMETELNKLQNMKLKLLAQKAQLEAQRNTNDNVDIDKVIDAITTTNAWTDDTDEEE